MRHFVPNAFGLTVIAMAVGSCGWSASGTGAAVENPSAFFGCYGFANNFIALGSHTAEITASSESTEIKGYFFLKSDVVVNTVNNLRLESSGRALRIGGETTGFFYKFNSQSNPTALLVVDDNSNERALPRIPC